MTRLPSTLIFLAAFVLIASLPASSTIPLPTNPDWESNPNSQVATGLGVSDLNGDGWVDLIVAIGNDIQRQPLVVYLNNGDGTYPLNPTWSSSDVDYNGHLDLADVNGDGDIDCAVAVYLGPGGFGDPGGVKVYTGNGDGTFSGNPTWSSSDSFYCFSCSFGDIDMDGLPDLACAAGDDYYNNPDRRRVYRNIGGSLELTPSWLSAENEYSLDVVWADFNGDAALDLAFAGTSGPDRIYFSQGGTIQTTAGWSSTDASIYANTAAAGDVDGDGWTDLAIADNDQLGGSGRFKLYSNLGNGTLSTTPTWESIQGGCGSHVSFIDIDEDGDLDLSTGQWWGPVRIYENVAGVLGTNPSYTSATNSVIENEVWEDVDNDGLHSALDASYVGDGTRRLFVIPDRPVRELVSVTIDGVAINPADIYLDSDDGWMILPSAPSVGELVSTIYITSADIDLAVSNWDSSVGQYLFYNFRNPGAVDSAEDLSALRLVVGPNPSDGPVRLWLMNSQVEKGGVCELFDVSGRRVRHWRDMGDAIVWDGNDGMGKRLAPGVYWARWLLPDRNPLKAKVIRR